MQSLGLAMTSSPDAGLPIDTPFLNFKYLDIAPRRGKVTLVAGSPGVGKSALISHIVTFGHNTAMYFSADTDFNTLGNRIGAAVLDEDLSMVDSKLRAKDEDAWRALIDNTQHIWFNWDPRPSLDDIYEEVMAYTYVTGAYPEVIVVDNLINVDLEGEGGGHRSYDSVMHKLQMLASQTNSAIIVLHHVTAGYNDGLIPVPLSGLMDQVGKRPRLVLTLFRASDMLLGVRVVKNSSGKAHADASWGCDISWDARRSYMKG